MDINRKLAYLREITQKYIQNKQYKKALPFYERAVTLSKFDFSIAKEYAYTISTQVIARQNSYLTPLFLDYLNF